jgi:hypothetical protein
MLKWLVIYAVYVFAGKLLIREEHAATRSKIYQIRTETYQSRFVDKGSRSKRYKHVVLLNKMHRPGIEPGAGRII